MPIFHGFGLGVCMHTCLHIGMKLIMIPTFKANKLGDLIKECKRNLETKDAPVQRPSLTEP